MSAYRPLAPHPTNEHEAPASAPNPTPPSRFNLRKNVASRACNLCREKRRKCDVGVFPSASCSSCLKQRIKCVVDQSSDLRTQRSRTESRDASNLLQKVRDYLRDNPDDKALLQLIRGNATLVEIGEQIDRLTKASEELSEPENSPLGFFDEGHNKPGNSLNSPWSGNQQRDTSPSSGDTDSPLESWSTTSISSTTSTWVQIRPKNTMAASPAYSEQAMQVGEIQDEPNSAESKERDSRRINVGWRNARQRYIAPGAVTSFGNLAMSNAVRSNGYPVDIQSRQLNVITGTFETCLPINCNACVGGLSSAMANAMLGFRDAARSMIAKGASAQRVLCMNGINLDLFFRDRMPTDPHNLATWACEFGKSFTFVPLILRLKATYVAAGFMRWLILPCQETYLMMSPIIRPLPSQLMVPHTADIDLCHLPCVRDVQMIHGGQWVDQLKTNSQILHWPYADEACTEEVLVEPDTGTIIDFTLFNSHSGPNIDAEKPTPVKTKRLSLNFTRFVDNPHNWSVHRNMLEKFPALEGQVRLHDDNAVIEER